MFTTLADDHMSWTESLFADDYIDTILPTVCFRASLAPENVRSPHDLLRRLRAGNASFSGYFSRILIIDILHPSLETYQRTPHS